MKNSSNSQIKKDYFWNTMGSGMMAAFSVILMWVVTRIMGAYVGGIFAFAYAVAQQLQTVGAYEMRTYQATDVREVFKFDVYLAARMITCAVMLLCAVVYGFWHEGFTEDAWIIILICVIKGFESFEDVYHGMFQQHKRLYIAGQALFFRMLITMLTFVVVLFISKNLLLTCAITVPVSIIALILLNIPQAAKITDVRPRFQWNRIKGLLISCFPLFIAAFVMQYVNNMPKYGMETYLTKEYQTYYTILFMPAFVINLFSGFAFKPMLTSLAEHWVENRYKRFIGTLGRGLAVVTGLTVLVIAGGYLLGIPVLSWFYGLDLSGYKAELVLLLLGGGFSAAGIILYYGLMVMRKQKQILYGYIMTLLAALPFSGILVRKWGIRGASILYMGLMLVRCVILLLTILWSVRTELRKKKKGD